MDPSARIGVPVVPAIPDRSNGRFDELPPVFVVQGAPYGLGDEAAPATCSHPSVQALDVIRVEGYVHAHGHTLAHRDASAADGAGLAGVATRAGHAARERLISAR